MTETEGATVSKHQSRQVMQDAANMRFHEYLAVQLDIARENGILQKDVATKLGYNKPNIIAMWKAGDARVPIEKIPALARAINVDPGFMFRLAMVQYWPEDADVVAALFGTVLSANEKEIIEKIRTVSKNSDPELTRERAAVIKAAFK